MYYDFYKKYFDIKDNIENQNVICPFHEDTSPSLSINIKTGIFNCFSCGEKGDVFTFYMKKHGATFPEAKEAITGNRKTEILSDTEVETAHHNLLNTDKLLNVIKVKRGWDIDVVKKLKLGFLNEYIFIPIYDEDDKLLNIRKYDIFHKHKNTKFKGIVGHNGIELYPISSLKHNPIIIFAGEPDTILALQIGMPAITFTGAEGAFGVQLLPKFKDKDVYICYDIDAKGVASSNILSQKLIEYASSVRIINIPPQGLPKNGDFTDLFIYCSEKGLDFKKVWNNTVKDSIEVKKSLEKKEPEYFKTDFYSSIKAEFFKKDIQFKCHVVGKSLSPFASPTKIKATCNFTSGNNCRACIMFLVGGIIEQELNPIDSISLIKCTDSEQERKIKDIMGIQRCNQVKIEKEIIPVEEIIISPEIDSDIIEQAFTARKAYVENDNMVTNKIYTLCGQTINDPKTQELTHYFPKQIPEIASLENFELNDEQKNSLRIFQSCDHSIEKIDLKLKNIYEDLTYNAPGELIKKREQLLFAYDLIFHSVLSFYFPTPLKDTKERNRITKGWTEVLVLGDERTGKTKTVQKLLRHYRAGEYRTLEGTTFAGLVGGITQIKSDKFFSWGVLPLNDGRLVVLDEGSALGAEGWGNLSSVRDTGIAERTVVGSTRRTSARVRLITLSNPQSTGKRIEHYTSGVEAIKDLIGKNEDIARFDFAVIVTQKDIPFEEINRKDYTSRIDHVHTSDLCSLLIQWAWSRKVDNVVFTKDAEQAIFDAANYMSSKYSDAIPLVQGSVQRIKIARLSVALACRLYSTEDGINITVHKGHVTTVINFLQEVYDSTYFGYDNYSIFKAREETIDGIDAVKRMIFTMANGKKFVEKMLSQKQVLFEDLMDFTGEDRERAKEIKQILIDNNCIKRIKNYYIKLPEFVGILKKLELSYRKEEF